MQEQWTAVDRYITDHQVPADPSIDAALQKSNDAGLPAINVAPNQGKLLHLLAKIHGARTILEIGTLGGYSTIWLARALPTGGKLVTLELDAKHAEVAAGNFKQAGLAGMIELRIGRASDSLRALAAEKRAPFDLIFIDADKASIPEYFTRSLQLSRPGSVIIVDNVIRKGAVLDPTSDDPGVQGVRKFNQMLAAEKRVSATTIQTVGSKGYDGFTLAVVSG